MSTDTIRALICGGGLMGRWHAHAAQAAGGELIGVVDPASDELARRLGVPAYPSLAEALRTQAPSLVHVCSPSDAHARQARDALHAGAHAVVEKPVAATLPETLALLDLAESKERSLTPMHQFAFQPWVERVAELGPLVAIEHAACSVGGEGLGDDARAAIAWGITWHGLSLAERLLPAGSLGDVSWSAQAVRPGELRATGVAGACAVSLSVSLAGRPPRNDLVVVGERGTLRADLFHGFGRVDSSGATRVDKALRPFRRATGELASAAGNLGRRAVHREPAFPGMNALVAAVYAHARGSSPAPLPRAHTVAVATAADALRAAAGLS